MNVEEIIQEFIPCEVCGNRNINNFYIHVFIHRVSLPYVKCGVCNEEYYFKNIGEKIISIKEGTNIRMISKLISSGRKHTNFEWVFHAKAADNINNKIFQIEME